MGDLHTTNLKPRIQRLTKTLGVYINIYIYMNAEKYVFNSDTIFFTGVQQLSRQMK